MGAFTFPLPYFLLPCCLCDTTCLQMKSLVDVRTQIDQLKASMAMKRAEMGTELIDHLTREEKETLSNLNREIRELKKQIVTCKTERIEVGNENLARV